MPNTRYTRVPYYSNMPMGSYYEKYSYKLGYRTILLIKYSQPDS